MNDNKVTDADVDAIANKVAQKLLVRKIYDSARFLVSMGFHIVQGQNAFKSYLPFSGDIDPDELKNPFGFLKMNEAGELNRDEGARRQLMRNIAAEIHARNLQGSVAELGVFKGDFAVEIRKVFPDRKLYLCDTFEGFIDADIQKETKTYQETLAFNAGNFKNTSVDSLLMRLGDSANCVIKKGLFGDTKGTIDDKFVFVNIDTDFHDSILEGLEFFYPRLVPGGYIMVHDYNNEQLPGAKAAVKEFCAANKVPYSPTADISAVIGKQCD